MIFDTLLGAGVGDQEVGGGYQILLAAIGICAPLLTAALGWIGAKIVQYFDAKIANEILSGTLAKLTTTVTTLVREAEQVAVAGYKAAKDVNSLGGSSLTVEEGEQIKQAVVYKIQSLWGPKGVSELGKILGLSDEGVVCFLGAKVEETVRLEKENSNVINK